MYEYKKVSLDYLDSAPGQLEFEQELPLTPAALFHIFEQSDTWAWAGIREVIWGSEPPFDSETVRTIVQPGGKKIDEQFLLWEQDRRMVFRLERGDIPLIGALIEDYTVRPLGENSCVLTWKIGYELRGLLKWLGPMIAPGIRKQFSAMFQDLGDVIRKDHTNPAP